MIKNYKSHTDAATKFIPGWVKVAVALGSTARVHSSGVAGTMSANHCGLQWSTVRNVAMVSILTLPISILLSGGLFWLFSRVG